MAIHVNMQFNMNYCLGYESGVRRGMKISFETLKIKEIMCKIWKILDILHSRCPSSKPFRIEEFLILLYISGQIFLKFSENFDLLCTDISKNFENFRDFET